MNRSCFVSSDGVPWCDTYDGWCARPDGCLGTEDDLMECMILDAEAWAAKVHMLRRFEDYLQVRGKVQMLRYWTCPECGRENASWHRAPLCLCHDCDHMVQREEIVCQGENL